MCVLHQFAPRKFSCRLCVVRAKEGKQPSAELCRGELGLYLGRKAVSQVLCAFSSTLMTVSFLSHTCHGDSTSSRADTG